MILGHYANSALGIAMTQRRRFVPRSLSIPPTTTGATDARWRLSRQTKRRLLRPSNFWPHSCNTVSFHNDASLHSTQVMCRLRVDSARLGRPDPPEHPSLTAEQEVCKYVVARSVQSAPRLKRQRLFTECYNSREFPNFHTGTLWVHVLSGAALSQRWSLVNLRRYRYRTQKGMCAAQRAVNLNAPAQRSVFKCSN